MNVKQSVVNGNTRFRWSEGRFHNTITVRPDGSGVARRTWVGADGATVFTVRAACDAATTKTVLDSITTKTV